MNPEVSVVLAVRDDPEGLRVAAASVLGQEGVDLELILVDDGSRDATTGIARESAARDGRVRILEGGGRGLTAALVLGCSEAQAPAIARQDAGDRSAPGRLARQLDLLRRRPEVVLASCWTEVVGPESEPLLTVTGGLESECVLRLDPFAAQEPESAGPTAHGSVVFRRAAYEAAGGYRPMFRLAQDWDLWWRLAERGGFSGVPAPLYVRQLVPGSISLRYDRDQRQMGTLAREAAQLRRTGGEEQPILLRAQELSNRVAARPAASKRAAARGLYFIGSLLRAQRDPRARRYFGAALRRDPLHFRAWLRWIQCLL